MTATSLLAPLLGDLSESLGAAPMRLALLAAGALGLLLMLPSGAAAVRGFAAVCGVCSRRLKQAVEHSPTARVQAVGAAVLATSLAFFAAGLPWLGDVSAAVVFWLLAGITLLAAAAAITMRSAVYAAIWFAVSLLGAAGLFIFQGAQFLGVATIVVYAGAIVVTFLFVIMLAQPRGHAAYDRISWGPLVEPAAVAAGALLTALLTLTIIGADSAVAVAVPEQSADAAPPPPSAVSTDTPPTEYEAPDMAHIGAELFGRHLATVEVAGTLLLAALVGAVAIIIAGKPRPENGEEDAGDA